jgi:MerR family transcriptional regulator, redox-sensitive transcriptional activator SoxR
MNDLTIGELANRVGVATSAIRFWESEGLIASYRTEGNQRRFGRSTIRRVSLIRAAQEAGLTLSEVSEALETLPHDKTATKRDWQRLSRSWRGRIDERIAELEALRDQLTDCIGCGCLSLRSCGIFNPADRAAGLGAGPRYLMGDERGAG